MFLSLFLSFSGTLSIKASVHLDVSFVFFSIIFCSFFSDFLIPGEWNGPQNDSYENYKEYFYELYKTFPNGITETYIHPALECDELKSITGAWHRRVWEHRLFSDPQTLQHIKACGIQLINYRDLKKMKGF